MFVRTKVFRNKDGSTRTYLQIVKGERVGGKVRQKVVANLGRLEHLEKGGLDRLVEGLARFSRYQLVKEKARKLEARWAKTWGPALVFRRPWEELGLEAVIEGLLEGRAVVSDYEEAVFAMVLNRLCDPSFAWLDAHRNVIITGPTGVGKTFIACALGERRLPAGLPGPLLPGLAAPGRPDGGQGERHLPPLTLAAGPDGPPCP